MAHWGELKCPNCEETFQMYVDANEARIDAEAKLRKSALQELSALGQASEAHQAQLAAEAKLAKAADAIDWALICWDDHCKHGYNMQGDWVHDARTILAELNYDERSEKKGQDDE